MSRRLPDTCINSALPQEDRAGVCRVHGGGFAGVIAAIVPEKEQDNYVEYISRFVGKENVYPMDIRAIGAVHIG